MATKAPLNIKVAKVENKIPDITNLATKAALNRNVTEIKNKIPDTTGFITTLAFNKLKKKKKKRFDTKMKEAAKSLARKSQVDNALDMTSKNREKK